MKNFTSGFMLAALLFGGFSAMADQEDGDGGAKAPANIEARFQEFLHASTDLAAVVAYERYELAEREWHKRRASVPMDSELEKAGRLIKRAGHLERQLMAARTELAAAYFKEKGVRVAEQYAAAIGMDAPK